MSERLNDPSQVINGQQDLETLGRLLPELDLPPAIAARKTSGVAIDSRTVASGDVFIALRGTKVNGQSFIKNAIEKGAVAVLVESSLSAKAGTIELVDTVPVITVANLSERVSAIAGQCYGDPSTHMKVVGVTGTNGKSTCVSLISQLFGFLGSKSATLGTLGVELHGSQIENHGMTTPDAAACQRILARLCWQEKVQLLAMEVSSHGLDQYRVAGIQFDVGLFTNISHDHLDYHRTIENYASTKQKLFESIGLQAAVINLDDPYAPQMVAAAKQNTKVITYSLLHFAADVYASDIQYQAAGVHFKLVTPWGETFVDSPLLGEFNVYNLIASIATLCANGCDFEAVTAKVPLLVPVAGRMQKVVDPNCDITAVVDYAHTPAALKHAIAATRVHTSGQLWVVFGCGGDRDKTKRPVMGNIAERFADHVIVTSDNPRSEDPQAIIDEVIAGFDEGKPLSFVDRREAIAHAIAQAKPGDVVLLAGKGHETYQIVGGQQLFFDDVQAAKQYMDLRPKIGGMTE